MAVHQQSFRRISALPGGSGVLVTRHVSAPVDLVGARAADLADALDDVVHAVDVALGQVAAAGVDRQAAAELDGAARRERAALALGAEPEVLELQQDGDREAVVELGDVDVGRAEPGPPVQRVGRRLGRQRRDVVAQHDRELDARLRVSARLPWATARISAGGLGASLARSALVTTSAAAPSVSRQKSNSRSGREIIRAAR